MKRSLFLLALTLHSQSFKPALPGYQFTFPNDHFNHPDFQTEWWYYTGNLHDAAGHAYGFELTFFRQGIRVPHDPTVWRPDQIYLAHLALTDLSAREFYHAERLNRAGPGLAGVSVEARKYWNGNWQVYWKNVATGEQQLQAVCDKFTLTLDLNPEKPPVIHGKDGISQKGPAPGEASHYISFTRLAAKGQLNQKAVEGQAWMDHEFFTEQPNPALSGWDWFAIQLNNNEELMLYRLRTKSAASESFSAATYVDASGRAHYLAANQFAVSPGKNWHSPASGATYPLAWQITVPSLGIELNETTPLQSQELYTPNSVSPAYWEGTVNYTGTIHNQPIEGIGYLEMTGYAQPIRLGH